MHLTLILYYKKCRKRCKYHCLIDEKTTLVVCSRWFSLKTSNCHKITLAPRRLRMKVIVSISTHARNPFPWVNIIKASRFPFLLRMSFYLGGISKILKRNNNKNCTHKNCLLFFEKWNKYKFLHPGKIFWS